MFSAVIGMGIAAGLDVAFYIVLAALAGREVLAAKNRNLPVVALVLLLGTANAVDHVVALGLIADDGLGWRSGIGLILLIISVIGGRIIPSFTRNWLTKHGVRHGLPGQPTRYDLVTIAVTAAAVAQWIAAPDGATGGVSLGVAGILQMVRLARWNGWRMIGDPIVFILHVGYLWFRWGCSCSADPSSTLQSRDPLPFTP